ncbi:MAG: cation:proton antiporter [Planctomycetota bacterium]
MNWVPTVAIALMAACLCGTLARRLGQSPLIGYLLAGVAIGPHTPGFVGDTGLAAEVADVGVVLLMFGVGLGFSFRDLWAVRRLAVPGALLSCSVVVALGTGLGLGMGWSIGGAAVLGMCLATASTVVIVRGMTELGMLAAMPGRLAIGWSLVEDLVTVILLVVLPAMSAEDGAHDLWLSIPLSLGKVVVLAALVIWGGGLLVPRLLAAVARAQSRELFTLAVLALAMGVAFLASEVFGLSLALGAFLGGMVVGRSDLAHQAAADALPMRDAFAVLFFVAVGMLFDPAFVAREPLLVVAALACVLVGKPLVAAVFLLRRDQTPGTAFSVSAGLAQVSEFSFVLAGLATELDILPAGGRDLVLATALASIAASPVLFRGVPRLDRWLSSRPAFARRQLARGAALAQRPADAPPLDQHVVLVGFGRVGSVLGEHLAARKVRFVAIDIDRALVERVRARGIDALYGDAGNPMLLDRAAIARACALVLTAPDAVTQRLAVEHARSVHPEIEVVARVHSEAHARELAALGGIRSVQGERELGLAMARQLLVALGVSAVEAEASVIAGRSGATALGAPHLFELPLPPDSPAIGRALANLGLPPSALVVTVVRDGQHLVARGPTELAAGDVLLLLASSEDARSIERLVTP